MNSSTKDAQTAINNIFNSNDEATHITNLVHALQLSLWAIDELFIEIDILKDKIYDISHSPYPGD